MKTIILAGGSGTRLFPLSREYYPKQFIRLFDNVSLFQKTITRALLFSTEAEITIVTNADHAFLVRDQLAEIDCQASILVEPEGKNTTPCHLLWCEDDCRGAWPIHNRGALLRSADRVR